MSFCSGFSSTTGATGFSDSRGMQRTTAMAAATMSAATIHRTLASMALWRTDGFPPEGLGAASPFSAEPEAAPRPRSIVAPLAYRPAGRGAASAEASAGPASPTTLIVVDPTSMESPALSSLGSEKSCSPFTNVPFALARSVMRTPASPDCSIRQWLRESSSSGIEMSFEDDRPRRTPPGPTSKRLPAIGPDVMSISGRFAI